MRKTAAYKVQVPRALETEFLLHDFYIAQGPNSTKVATYWQQARHSKRYDLLKRAQELQDDDISTAYADIMRQFRDTDGEGAEEE